MTDSDGSAISTPPSAPAGAEPLPLSELLLQIARTHSGERLTLSQLAAELRDRAWGGLLLIFAAINLLPLPPGATTVTGLPLLVLTAQLAAGRATPWFPRRVDRRGITEDEITRLVAKLLPWERRVEKLLKPRWTGLTSHRGARVIGVVSLLLSVVLWLPIPLGNHAPAAAMTLFALALLYRDGLLVVLGALATLVSIALLSVTVGAVWLASILAIRGLFG